MSVVGKSLQLLTPMYNNQCTGNYFTSAMALQVLCTQSKVDFGVTTVWNESLISRARNRLVDGFLKASSAEYAIFIDADIGFDPRDVLAMLEFDRDIIGAPCSKKSLRWDRIQAAIRRNNGKIFTGDELARIGADMVFNPEPFSGQRQINLGEPQEMASLGTGLLMVKRAVFQKFREEYPDRWFEAPNDKGFLPGPIHDFFRVGVEEETHKYHSEDYWFCMEAKKLGFKVWLCPWMVTSHVGATTFIGDMPTAATAAGGL